MTAGDHSDTALVVAAQSGSRAAFGTLVARHYGPLLCTLTWQVGDPELAADLAQDTFVEAQRCLDRVTEDRPFRAWLYGIARNMVRRAKRARRLRRLVSLDWLHEQRGDSVQALHQADGSTAAHERALIARTLSGLSPPLREALILHRLAGYTTKEIAQILSIAPKAAEQRVTRANKLFRQRYIAFDCGEERGER
jgi:RNA polymerase sigma factor (sigma-70 family)